MKSTLVVFIAITNLLLFHTQLVLGSPDSTYFMVHEQADLAERENNLSSVPVLADSETPKIKGESLRGVSEALESTTKRPNPIGIGLDRPASDGHSSGATHSLSINLDGRCKTRIPEASHENAVHADCFAATTGNTTAHAQFVRIQTPSIVEAFYSKNQRLLQSWSAGYDNSLFVDPNQAGFISHYFSILRARNLIVP